MHERPDTETRADADPGGGVARPRPSPLARLGGWLASVGPWRHFGVSRRRRLLREVVVPLHGFLEQLHEHTIQAYEALALELRADPRAAGTRIIDSVQDVRRHLKTYQLVLGEGRPETLETWMAESCRLEMLGHALAWSSKAFKRARDQLAAVTVDPDAPEVHRSDDYFQALTMYHTLRSRGSPTFRIYPEPLGKGQADFAPGVDLGEVVRRRRTPPAELVTFLVYERTDESVTRELGEILEGALWTKRRNWQAVEAAYRAVLMEVDRRSPTAVPPEGTMRRRADDLHRD